MRAQGLVDGLDAVGGLGDHLEIVLGLQDRSQPAAQERLVVGDQELDHGSSGSLIDQPSRPRRRTVPAHGRTNARSEASRRASSTPRQRISSQCSPTAEGELAAGEQLDAAVGAHGDAARQTLREARHGRQRERRAVVEQPGEPAQLVHRVRGEPAHGLDRARGAAVGRVEQPLGGRGLHLDGGDAVRDEVVEVSRQREPRAGGKARHGTRR